MTIVSLDRERALRLARVVRSWHRQDDDAGAFDCFKGMARGDITEEELASIWREVEPERPSLALYDEFMLLYRAWAGLPKGTEFPEDVLAEVAEHVEAILGLLQK
jgi:hypothetical protein